MRTKEWAWIAAMILVVAGAGGWVATQAARAAGAVSPTPIVAAPRTALPLRVGGLDVHVERSRADGSPDDVAAAWRAACDGELVVRVAPSGQQAIACLDGPEAALRVGWLEPHDAQTSVTTVRYRTYRDLGAWMEAPDRVSGLRPPGATALLEVERAGYRARLVHLAVSPQEAVAAWRAVLAGTVRETADGLVATDRGRRTWITLSTTRDGTLAYVAEEAG